MQRSLVVLVALSLAAFAGCAREGTLQDIEAPPSSGSGGATASGSGATNTASPGRTVEPIPLGRKYSFDERWALTDPKARTDLQGTKFGEQEIKEFWTRKGWHLTQREEEYFAMTEKFLKEGKLTIVSRWYQVPYSPVYQTIEPVTLLGVSIPPQTEFWLEPCENADKIFMGNPRFPRSDNYAEEHEGHVDDERGKLHQTGAHGAHDARDDD